LPPYHDLETGKVTTGYKTAIAVIAACCVGYAAWVVMGNKVEEAVAHQTEIYPHVAQFEAVKADAQSAKQAANEAKGASERAEKAVGGINAKIDFLMQNEIEQAQKTPDGARRARRAASRVRQKQGVVEGDPDDPLKGVDGL
jgi:hypothetical protein